MTKDVWQKFHSLLKYAWAIRRLAPVALLFYALPGRTQNPPNVGVDILRQDSLEYGQFTIGPTFEELIHSGKQYDALTHTYTLKFHPHEETPPGHSGPHDMNAEVRSLAINSDLIIIGRVVGSVSAPTSSHMFLFTDSKIAVKSVFFDKKHQVVPGTTIVVSRPGGTMLIGGALVKAEETEYPQFTTDQDYLFFLTAMPSGSYRAGVNDVFSVDPTTIRQVRNHPRIDGLTYTPAELKASIEAAIKMRQVGGGR